ncbi:uncharacterized protein LOC123672207 [Harmonia axyridis]|uniref:uncharacterized protein LOC123672207 n=1 Tax=Harmonia axyridis TaxID=115357 RepID=UPI001E275E91|nr:uncharacterized protein LOC123672207 [Harmonia axyridis]
MAKRKYGVWNEEDMERALASYRNGDMGLNQCCRQYGIPKPTLKRHLDSKNIKANEGTKLMGRHPTLPPDVEQQLVDHLKKLEACFFGLTITDVRRLAFQIAVRNGIPHVFNEEKQIAGKKWYYSFMNRHKDISLREPQATSLARAQGFSRENVKEFLEILKKAIDENKMDATTIYNIDETGVSTVQNKCQKVIAEKGKRAVGSISSGERGVNTTVVCCASAAGMYIPPLIIFKRMRMCNELKVGAPPGSLVDVSESGWINSELFVKWLRHFIGIVKPNRERKVLLLLDGHSTHSKNLEALIIARDAGVIMLQLPAHTTHRLQPLDRSFFKPFKGYFTQAVEKWLRTNPGLRVTQYQISHLVTEAYGKAATIENSCNGFKCSGVWPVDSSIFKESDFLPAECLKTTLDHNNNEEDSECLDQEKTNMDENQPLDVEVTSPNRSTSSTSNLNVPIEIISPLPKPTKKRNGSKLGTNSKEQKAVILTSSPYKNEIQLAQELKLAKEKVKELQMKIRPLSEKIKVTKSSQDVADFSHILTKKSTTNTSTRKKQPQEAVILKKDPNLAILNQAGTSAHSDVLIEIEPEEWFCLVCEENSIEDMVQCLHCSKWAHESCAGSKAKIKKFICSSCSS